MNNSIKTAQCQAGLDFAHTADSRPTALNRAKKFILTLLALLTVSAGAWVAEEKSESFTTTTAGQKEYTGSHVKITATDLYDTGKIKLFREGQQATIETLNGETITKIVVTASVNTQNCKNVKTTSGTVEGGDPTSTIKDVNATSVVISSQFYVGISQITVYYTPDPVTLNADKTEATMEMPASDVTVSYELVRDLEVGTRFDGVPEEPVAVKKDGDKFVFASGTAPAIVLIDLLADNAPIQAGATYRFEQKNAENGQFETSQVDLLDDAQPGTWRIVTTATDDGPYDGSTHSAEFTLIEQYDLVLQLADAMSAKGVQPGVTVGTRTVTLDTATGTATTTAQPAEKVTIKAKRGYVIESVEAGKPAAAAEPVVSGNVNVETLKVGDIIKGITDVSGNVKVTLKKGRYKDGGNVTTYDSVFSVYQMSFASDGYTIKDSWGAAYTPVDADGNDGNAWIVLNIDANGPILGGYTAQ